MNERDHIIAADWTWTGHGFQRDLAVHIGADGRIASVDSNKTGGVRLANHALLPGMVYAHSHAFQRALRNRPERFASGGGNFWSWRDTMYQLVETIDVDSFHETCAQCFREMLRAGVTAVGEFHYLHHHDAFAWEFDEAILAAAREVGIRICLIQCWYAHGGVDRPLGGAQKRFDGISMGAFLTQFDKLRSGLDPGTQTLALAAHSIRGATIEEVTALYQRAIDLNLPFHIHVEEQRQEIDDCIAHYGKRPLRLLLDRLLIDPRFTAIHCTHSHAADLRELVSRGGGVCLCPSTEGNLADGIPKLRDMRASGLRLCIGSDCNLRLSMNEDLRWLEFVHRLGGDSSGVVVDEQGQVAPALFDLATINGAKALNLNTGTIVPGNWADLVAIDLNHPSLKGSTPESILHAFIFGCGNEPIDHVWVGGVRRR